MCEACNSDFGTVGDSPLSYVGDGKASSSSKYTKSMPKGTMGRGSSPTGRAGNKGSSLIKEANGPKCSVQTTLYKANASDANMTQRNVYTVPSAAGVGGFWKERSRQGQVM